MDGRTVPLPYLFIYFYFLFFVIVTYEKNTTGCRKAGKADFLEVLVAREGHQKVPGPKLGVTGDPSG